MNYDLVYMRADPWHLLIVRSLLENSKTMISGTYEIYHHILHCFQEVLVFIISHVIHSIFSILNKTSEHEPNVVTFFFGTSLLLPKDLMGRETLSRQRTRVQQSRGKKETKNRYQISLAQCVRISAPFVSIIFSMVPIEVTQLSILVCRVTSWSQSRTRGWTQETWMLPATWSI